MCLRFIVNFFSDIWNVIILFVSLNHSEDSSTPLHFASAQGSVDMVTLMKEAQPERFDLALNTEDILKMTPLHKAAIFDHVNVVDFLINNVSSLF